MTGKVVKKERLFNSDHTYHMEVYFLVGNVIIIHGFYIRNILTVYIAFYHLVI